MSRSRRRISATGYYHLIVRGIGKQILFEEEKDYRYYLKMLERYSSECGIVVCCYCLMENHVHLLVCDAEGNLALFMKKTGISYAGYYNRKYERSGHLFQDRYFSEAVEDKRYLMTVFRYILNNPAKAGICAAGTYPWSSYTALKNGHPFVNTDIFISIFGSAQTVLDFLEESSEDEDPAFEGMRRGDMWAIKIINSELGVKSGTSLQKMEREERNTTLRKLKAEGLSVRQIERLTGISRNVIQRA